MLYQTSWRRLKPHLQQIYRLDWKDLPLVIIQKQAQILKQKYKTVRPVVSICQHLTAHQLISMNYPGVDVIKLVPRYYQFTCFYLLPLLFFKDFLFNLVLPAMLRPLVLILVISVIIQYMRNISSIIMLRIK